MFVTSDGSGGLAINGKLVASLPREGQTWITGLAKADEDLLAHVKKALQTWLSAEGLDKEALAKRITRVLMSISEDPNAGCMLVILSTQDNPFDDMGVPWETRHGEDVVSMPDDVLTSLMAMDGASCLFYSSQKKVVRIQFRRLVSPPLSKPKEVGLHEDTRRELDGAGTRKWSAASAAKRKEVALIISVSQDGPIHIYEKVRKDGREQVRTSKL